MKTKFKFNLDTHLLVELTRKESLETQGGDKFMRDLGHALGWAWESACNSWASVASQGYFPMR